LRANPLYFYFLRRNSSINSPHFIRMKFLRAIILSVLVTAIATRGQSSNSVAGPDPREIPLPPIKTAMGTLPGVNDLPVRPEMPDVMTMNNGQKVTTVRQWKKRREEMKRILEYYAVGQMPPPPGNVKGEEIKSQLVLDGKVTYRLMHLTFGPERKLALDIGIFTPIGGQGPFPPSFRRVARHRARPRCRVFRKVLIKAKDKMFCSWSDPERT
jgi:hypothetical protein